MAAMNSLGMKGALQTALSGKPAMNLDPSVTNRYFQDSVANPMMQNFQQKILPQLNEAYAGGGALWSSRRGDAINTNLSNMNANLTSARSDLAYKDQQMQATLNTDALNRQIQGVGLGMQYAQQPYNNSLLMEQVLAPFQEQQNTAAQNSYNEWLRTQPYNNPYAQMAMGFIGQNQQAAYQKGVNPYVKAGVGIAGGAATGAIAGSVVPGIGTGIGAIVGALGGAAGAF